MALGPVLRRYVMRRARRRGLFWKTLAGILVGRRTLKRLFGKHPEHIAVERLGPDKFLHIITATPMSRREQRRTGINRAVLLRQAEADVRAANRSS